MQKRTCFFVQIIALIAIIIGLTALAKAEEFDYQNITTIMSIDKPGDYNTGISVPYTWDEYEIIPEMKIWIEYYRNQQDIIPTDAASTRAKCLFQTEITEQKNISLPGVGYILIKPIVTIVNPVNVDLKQGNENGINQFFSSNWSDAEKDLQKVSGNHNYLIDLSKSPSYIDVLMTLIHEEEYKHRFFFFIKFTTHTNIGYIKLNRINILGDTNKLVNMTDAQLMQCFNGGFSPKYNTWIDLSLQAPQDRQKTIEEFTNMDK